MSHPSEGTAQKKTASGASGSTNSGGGDSAGSASQWSVVNRNNAQNHSQGSAGSADSSTATSPAQILAANSAERAALLPVGSRLVGGKVNVISSTGKTTSAGSGPSIGNSNSAGSAASAGSDGSPNKGVNSHNSGSSGHTNSSGSDGPQSPNQVAGTTLLQALGSGAGSGLGNSPLGGAGKSPNLGRASMPGGFGDLGSNLPNVGVAGLRARASLNGTGITAISSLNQNRPSLGIGPTLSWKLEPRHQLKFPARGLLKFDKAKLQFPNASTVTRQVLHQNRNFGFTNAGTAVPPANRSNTDNPGNTGNSGTGQKKEIKVGLYNRGNLVNDIAKSVKKPDEVSKTLWFANQFVCKTGWNSA